MKYLLDVHTHTLVSGHAYSTIREMAQAACKHNLALLGISEHAPNMPGSCQAFYFQNLNVIHRDDYAIPLLFGSELNILDENGSVDLTTEVMSSLDYNIASLHPPCIPFMTKEATTKTILRVIENKHIHMIGHLDDARYPLDYNAVAKAAKEFHTLLEVNNSSLMPNSFRRSAKENYKELLAACEKYGTKIILNSDAHVDSDVGRHDLSDALIQEHGFPEELIVNSSLESFYAYLK